MKINLEYFESPYIYFSTFFLDLNNLNNLKQFTTILMLVLIGYNSIGYFFVFKLRHQKAEQEFNDYISSGNYSETDLVLFKIPVTNYSAASSVDFNRVEGDLEQNGKFYEVIRQTIKDDTVFVYCLNNEKEEQLYAYLAEHISNHIVDSKAAKSKSSGKAFYELTNEYLSKENLRVSFQPPYKLIKPICSFTHEFFKSPISSVPTPPPQFS